MAAAVHRQLAGLDGAVPVVEIARALDIVKVQITRLDGCEGILLTDAARSSGGIIVNNSRGPRRARFSIAHELGHFLLERHVLSGSEGFTCNGADMREGRAGTVNQRQETEANTLAINLLAPAFLIRPYVEAEPSIDVMLEMRDALDISLAAAGRVMVDRHDDPLALVACHNGKIRYIARGEDFPWIGRQIGALVSGQSETARAVSNGTEGLSDMSEGAPLNWTNADVPELFEQVRIGRNGHSLTLLCATLPEDPDEV